jgi:hypothetical protein
MADKVELVIAALQQRIGEIVSNYETNVAILRAEVTQLTDELEKLKSEQETKKKTKE